MKNTLWTIFELTVNIFQSVIVLQTIKCLLGMKPENKRNKVLGVFFNLLLFAELSFINSIVPFEGLSILISTFIIFLYSLICLRGIVLQKLFWSVFIIFLIVTMTAIVLNIEGFIIGKTYLSLITDKNIYRFIGVSAIQIIVFYCTRLIIKRKQRAKDYLLKWNEWLILLVIPAVSVFTITFVILVAINAESELTQIQHRYLVLSVVGILITNILVYGLYIKSHKEHENQLNCEILRQVLMNREKSIEETKILYQSVRSMRHDLKQHIGIILMMLHQEKYDQAIKYIEKYDRMVLGEIKNKIYCENDIINYLINYKSKICKEKGIKSYIYVSNNIPNISELDLCVLIGNAMDNAIEGTGSKLSEDLQREIYLELKTVDNFFIITVKNTIYNSVLQNNPKLISTKKENKNHGIGIASMKEILKTYHGSIDFSEANGFFCCSILLDILK